jgi:misacylated tRNA(Ala) deacylase
MATETLFYTAPYARDCTATVTAIDEHGVQLDRTICYPTGGGQPGDTGVLHTSDGRELAISDTRKGGAPDEILHIIENPAGLAVGDSVELRIDWERRHRHMRMHTCLHLLCSLIDAPVTGGSVAVDRGRLDFDLPESPDKVALNEQLAELIARNAPISARWISDAELDAQPELVRTMSVQPPRGSGQVRVIDIDGIDLQPCGGTHLQSTGEVGAVRVRKIEKKGRQNRRISLVFDD